MSGLTAAAYLSRTGHDVTVFEQYSEIGGVTTTLRDQQFGWDIGPLLLEGFLPGEAANRILNDLGVVNRVKVVQADRGISFPDFSLWKPEKYSGPYWRREYLKKLFPQESEGLDVYYKFYDKMMDLVRYNNRLDALSGLRALLLKVRMWFAFQKVKDKQDWTAEKLMDHFFEGPELKALYTAILADFVVKPSQFPAMGVPVSNIETAFDKRIPLEIDTRAPLPGYSYILGGCGQLVNAVASSVREGGGQIHTSTTIQKIRVENSSVKGIITQDGHFEAADIVIATGGARETFLGLIGSEYLPTTFTRQLKELMPMQSVLMIHLGINFDPGRYQSAALCYYYGTYNIEKSVEECQEGIYHEGKKGFLIYIPSKHSPELAPSGYHAVTIYTIAPNHLSAGNWNECREELADKIISEAEKFIPGLRKGTVARIVITPADFRQRTHQDHHSFGGLAPLMGQENPSHRTLIKGLWFIGSQSESGGGVKGVMIGARNAVRKIQKGL